MINDVIHGQRWHELCDIVVDSGINPISKHWEYIDINSHMLNEKSCIVFSKNDYLNDVFKRIADSKYYHVLISGNSDIYINDSDFKRKPNNIIRWYAQNPMYDTPNLIPIPIGLERPFGGGQSADYKTMSEVIVTPKTISNLIYMNHNDINNPQLRTPVTNFYRDKDYVTYELRVGFERYLRNMRNHKFVLSPNGNGIDCHRTWEALYLGVVPIVNRSIMSEAMSKLYPMIVVDDMTKLDIEYLKQYEIEDESYIERLQFSYWKNKIEQECKDVRSN